MSSRAEEQLNQHEKALQRAAERNGHAPDPRVTARFEEARKVVGGETGPSPQRDASLNWAAGQHVATQARRDQPFTQEQAVVAGLGHAASVEKENATEPDTLSTPRPVRKQVGGARSGVRAIIGHAEGDE